MLEDDLRLVGDGSIGICVECFKEKMKAKSGELSEIEVRSTVTCGKLNGKWKMIMAHRDTQFA